MVRLALATRLLSLSTPSSRSQLVGLRSNVHLRVARSPAAPTLVRPYAVAVKKNIFAPLDTFQRRHVGPDDTEVTKMLGSLGYRSMDEFIHDTVPQKIRIASGSVNNESISAFSESQLLQRVRDLADTNKPARSYIGMGYWNAVVPPVILRNVMENPAWYTQYTPYQPEIAQGRLESLVNFQTMVASLTGMHIANASLLDEATAAAEAMVMSFASFSQKKKTFLVDSAVSPQTLSVLSTRATGFGIELKVGNITDLLENDASLRESTCGVLVQYPDVNGSIRDYADLAKQVHGMGAVLSVATDLLALTMLKPPGEWGADIVFGNSARFGVPSGYGGPHAAFFAVSEKLKRKMPGRLIGRSRDAEGNPAYRLALQTREQHIRREKATSNICTSQALLANMAAMYAIYHGPQGLREIAERVHAYTQIVASAVQELGLNVENKDAFFDTLSIEVDDAEGVHRAAAQVGINFRRIDDTTVGVTLDESVSPRDLLDIINVFRASVDSHPLTAEALTQPEATKIPDHLARTSQILHHPVFNTHHSETEMLRYIHHLQNKDLSLVHAMIPLGSCTMKLNSTTSMIPVTMPEFGNVHPFAPLDQVEGYTTILRELEKDLCIITGFQACSLQPNSGAAGEYAGLSVIRAYHRSRGDTERDICLIPVSAHGTNPASAVMAGFKVVAVKSLPDGSLDLADLKEKAEKHKDKLAACMITYPSTFGVFEESVTKACQIVHENGGQVYIDGANLNAQVGLTNPATCGGDVCHLNLHKTFSIPHGGGGPGMGPICVAGHLAPFLPTHPVVPTGGPDAIQAVSAAPYGSASILLISWAYIKMLGGEGLTHSSAVALLNANYIASRLKNHYTLKYKNAKGRVAHELLIDLAEFEKSAGLKVMDFAKRLQDYGFHPPTCSWPIPTAMLIEPTESETLEELDRFCEAMIQIRQEVEEIITGKQPKDNNVLKNAPHPIHVVVSSEEDWKRPYSRQKAAYPLEWLHQRKFWPTTSRIDDAYGDLNLNCECPTVEELAEHAV